MWGDEFEGSKLDQTKWNPVVTTAAPGDPALPPAAASVRYRRGIEGADSAEDADVALQLLDYVVQLAPLLGLLLVKLAQAGEVAGLLALGVELGQAEEVAVLVCFCIVSLYL